MRYRFAMRGFLYIGSVAAVALLSGTAIAAAGTASVMPGVSQPIDQASPPGSADAQAILQHMLEAETSLVLEGDQDTTVVRNGRPVRSEQHVIKDGDRAIRLEYHQPPRMAGQVLVDNGRIFWKYRPVNNTLQVGPSRVQRLRQHLPQVIRQVMAGKLQVRWIGQSQLAGRTCDIVEVSGAAAANLSKRQFWVDRETGAQMRIDQYGAGGALQSSSYFTDITFDTTAPKGAFSPPRVPSTVQTIPAEIGTPLKSLAAAAGQAGCALLQPQYLPDGFSFQTAEVGSFGRRTVVALRFANGLNVFSLFESPQRPGAAARPEDDQVQWPRPNVCTTVRSGIRLVLVGNIPPQELEKVIESAK